MLQETKKTPLFQLDLPSTEDAELDVNDLFAEDDEEIALLMAANQISKQHILQPPKQNILEPPLNIANQYPIPNASSYDPYVDLNPTASYYPASYLEQLQSMYAMYAQQQQFTQNPQAETKTKKKSSRPTSPKPKQTKQNPSNQATELQSQEQIDFIPSFKPPPEIEQKPLAERVNDFKEMLEKLNLNPATATWENTLMKIANDPRYRLLKTVGEKKRVFNEFLQEKENKDKKAKDEEIKKYKESFFEMLDDAVNQLKAKYGGDLKEQSSKGKSSAFQSLRIAQDALDGEEEWDSFVNEDVREDITYQVQRKLQKDARKRRQEEIKQIRVRISQLCEELNQSVVRAVQHGRISLYDRMRDAILAAKVDDNQQRDSSSTSDNTLEQFLRCYNELLSLTQSAQENENEEMYEEQIGKESNADSASDRESSRSSTDRSNRRRRRQEKRSKDQKDDGRREEGRRRRFESNKALDREIGLTFEQAMLEAHAILNMQVQQVRELATLGDWLGLFRWQGGRKELENSQAQIQIKNHLSILDDPYTPFPWKDQRLFEQTNGGEFNCPLCSSFIWPFSANYSTVQSSLCQKHSELIEKMKGELELMEQKDLSTVWLCRIASCVCEQIVRTDEIFFSEIQKLRMNTGKKIRKRIISEGKGLIVTNSINKLISKSSKDSDTKQGKHSSHSSLDGISIAELAQSVLKKNTLEPTDARQFLKDSKHLLQKLQDYAEKEVNDIHQLHASRGMMKDTKEEMIEDNQKTANELVDEFLQSVIQLEVFNEETLKARINKQENENKQIAQFMKEKIMNETKRTKEEEREKRKQLAMEQTKKDKNEEKKKESDIIQHVQVNIKQEEVGSKQIKQTGEDLEEGEERDPDADMQVDIPQKESLNVSESEESGGENIGVQKDEAGLNIQGVTNDETGIQMLISDENSSDSSEESSEDEDINSEEEKKINKDDGSKNKNEKDKIKRSKKVKRKRKHSKSSSSSSSDSNDRKHRHKRRKGDHHKKSHRHRRGSRARDAGYGTKRRRFNDSDETPARELEEGEVEEGEILD